MTDEYSIRHFLWGFVMGFKGFREGFLMSVLYTHRETLFNVWKPGAYKMYTLDETLV